MSESLTFCRLNNNCASQHYFSPFHTRFIVRSDDNIQVKLDKVKLLLLLSNYDNHQAILREFIVSAISVIIITAIKIVAKCYSQDVNDQVAAAAIHAIGRCARMFPDCTSQCLSALMTMIEGNHGERIHITTVCYDRVISEQLVIDVVVNNAVLVLKHLIQSKPASPAEVSFSGSQLAIISRLARRIEDISHPRAKACVLWLVGQYSATEHGEDSQSGLSGAVDWAPDVLRRSAKSFKKEVLRFMFQLAEFSLICTHLRLHQSNSK